ncbi:CzcE family metal-binding protein [Glaciimonas immobilis]|nr:CzcE family metal-binding protein [Glaciimonas immobilis]
MPCGSVSASASPCTRKPRAPKGSASLLALCLSTGCALFSGSAPAASPPQSFLGTPAPMRSASQTISISPTTNYVNVTSGQIVRFSVGGQEFAWNFDVPNSVYLFDLNQVAPANLLDHAVRVYVAPNPISIF